MASALDKLLELPEYESEPEVELEVEEKETIPPDIDLADGEFVFGLDLHPSENVAALGLITGAVKLYKYAIGECSLVFEAANQHRAAVRDVVFTLDGAAYYSVGSDKVIRGRDCETNQIFFDCQQSKHKHAINKIMVCTERNYVTGDDVGTILLWDVRQPKPCGCIHDNIDQITDFDYHPDFHICLAASLDCGYSVIDFRKFELLSYSYRLKEKEIEAISVMDCGRKIVAGTSTGDIFIWRWGLWDHRPIGRLKGHLEDLQCMLPVTDEHVLTGASDGIIRLIRLFPDNEREFLHTVAVITEHENATNLTIENIKVSDLQAKMYPPQEFAKKKRIADAEFEAYRRKKAAGGDDDDDGPMLHGSSKSARGKRVIEEEGIPLRTSAPEEEMQGEDDDDSSDNSEDDVVDGSGSGSGEDSGEGVSDGKEDKAGEEQESDEEDKDGEGQEEENTTDSGEGVDEDDEENASKDEDLISSDDDEDDPEGKFKMGIQVGSDSDDNNDDDDDDKDEAASSASEGGESENDSDELSQDDGDNDDDDDSDEEGEYVRVGPSSRDRRSSKKKRKRGVPRRLRARERIKRIKKGLNLSKRNDVRREFFRGLTG